MINLKTFKTPIELNEAIKAIENAGIQCGESVGSGEYVLQVHVGHFIKARDIILEMQAEKKKLEAWGKST